MIPVFLLLLVSSIYESASSTCWTDVLCAQRPGFCFQETNASVVVASVQRAHLDLEECVLCGQISSSKHIDCKKCANELLLDYSGSHCGLQDVSLQVFDPSFEVLPNVTTLPHYIVTANEAQFYGFVNITHPQFGVILSNDLYVELVYSDLTPVHNQRPREIQYDFKVTGIFSGVYPGNLNHLASSNIEPGSWFYTVTPLLTEPLGVMVKGLPSQGYIEFVMEEADIAKHRRFFDHEDTRPSSYAVETAISAHSASGTGQVMAVEVNGGASTQNPLAEKVNVCIWSSDNMDGQKRIWLQQIEHLDPARFRFTWMLTFKGGRTLAQEKEQGSENVKNNSMYATVSGLFERNRNGRVIDSPFNGIALDVDALHEDPGDGRRPAAEIWANDELNLYRSVYFFLFHSFCHLN